MGEKLVRKGRWGGQAGRAGGSGSGRRTWRSGGRPRAGGQLSRARPGAGRLGRPFPYSMPTTVARSGTVTRARAVVMNVPWAIVFASPWYW